MNFNSQIQIKGNFNSEFSDQQIKNEPMFFNCDLNFVLDHGRIITRRFLQNLPDDWIDCDSVIDSRVHMLMPGWCPAIPGFHHDDISRNQIDGQPDYQSPPYYSEHLTGMVNADIAPTLFALGQHQLPLIESGVVYRQWHPIVEQQLKDGVLSPYYMESGKYVQFDWQSIHTAVKAVKNGWRWFIRLSRKTDRVNHITNEIRNQVQVYLENPTDGW